MASKGDI